MNKLTGIELKEDLGKKRVFFAGVAIWLETILGCRLSIDMRTPLEPWA